MTEKRTVRSAEELLAVMIAKNDKALAEDKAKYKAGNKKVAEWARKKRIKSGHSLRFIASCMGVSAPFLHDLERGKRNWPIGRVEAWGHAIRSQGVRK